MEDLIAHNLDCDTRTADIEIKSKTPFSRMPLKSEVLRGLKQAGFEYPTILQASAITLGNMGLDLVVQAKSGTGKTLVFCTILLNAYQTKIRKPQALVVTPTREIAVQIEEILNQIGATCDNFKAICAIGGIDVMNDRKRLQNARAVVGTPGRLVHLIKSGMLNLTHTTLLVLDEVDKLLNSFQHDVRHIKDALPKKHQTICCSATIDNKHLNKELTKYLRNPLLIAAEGQATVLLGIKQFVYALPKQESSALEIQEKLRVLSYLFCSLAFKQCLVFAGSQARAETYCAHLRRSGWSCAYISAAQDQQARLEIFKLFQRGVINILIATDLMSRGVDLSNLNLIINLDVPNTLSTYLHRIGRAGRFGTHGIAINILATQQDYKDFNELMLQSNNILQVMRYPAHRAASSLVEERNIWDFCDMQQDLLYYGKYDPECIEFINGIQDAVEDETVSDLNTKTFYVENGQLPTLAVVTDVSIGNEADVEDVEEEEEVEEEEDLVHLPSFSNTIDDASSLMADDIRSELTEDLNEQQLVQEVEQLKLLLFKSPQIDSSELKGEENDAKNIKNKAKLFNCCAEYNKFKNSFKCN